jgi:hypothetical protein
MIKDKVNQNDSRSCTDEQDVRITFLQEIFYQSKKQVYIRRNIFKSSN